MRRWNLTLTQRLSVVFAVLLLVCSGTSAWMQVRANRMHEAEVIQGLSRGLAEHIAANTQLMDANGMKPDAVRRLFGQLMVVNPSVEVYLLDAQGHITGHAAPEGHLRRMDVDLAPIHRLLDGEALPIYGDDPRNADAQLSPRYIELKSQIWSIVQNEVMRSLQARADQ